jgi:hypothetical protein
MVQFFPDIYYRGIAAREVAKRQVGLQLPQQLDE